MTRLDTDAMPTSLGLSEISPLARARTHKIDAIYEGENLEVMNKIDRESVDLIYAGPPFYTHKQFEIIWHDGAKKENF